MQEIADRIADWREHPATMVRELFGVEPDAWQLDALDAFPRSPRMAMKACKGPGKTAVLAWLGWNFLLTRPHPVIGATSISGDNLKANLWTELARWRGRSPLLEHLFEQTKTAIFSRQHPNTWKCEARTWPKDADATQIGNALAGLHGAYVMWLLDESGDYPNAIMANCEGIFSGEPIEAHIVQAGNPTQLEGPLYRAFTVAADLWYKIEITADPDDPKRTPRVSVEHARQMIKQYGRDNPWILVSIFGKFPPASFNALIGIEEVREAMRRYYREHEIGEASRVLGVDVARYGNAQSVIAPRWGLQMLPFKKYRNIDSTQGAGQVVRVWNEWGADGCLIDVTGGFGAGWYDQIIRLGKSPIGVQFSGTPHNKNRYVNKRAEMAFDLVEWIKRGGALPEDDGLAAALTKTTYTFQGDRLILEPKEEVEEKVGQTLDEFDAAILTFAEPIGITDKRSRALPKTQPEYQPFAELDRIVKASYRNSAMDGNYDPFAAGRG